MGDRIEEIVAGLERSTDVTGVWRLAKRRLAAGDPSFLADLGIALTRRYGSGPTRGWQYRSVLDQLLRLLALTPGAENVAQVLRLTTAIADREPARYTAALLAAGQQPQDLAVVFAGGGSRVGAAEELRACLVHELVLRGRPVDGTPAIARWARSPHWDHHPLGRLPLSLTALEGRPTVPTYSLGGGSSFELPFGPPGGAAIEPAGGAPVPATETTDDPVASAIAAAVANWADGSNGRIEARVFELAGDADPGVVAAVLPTLGLECLGGLHPHSRVVFPGTPTRAWQLLFAAASTGGAYNSGGYGAYGRLAAWRSVAALVGLPADASPADIAQSAHQCAWYSLSPATGWFARVAWDLGLIVVAPDRRRLAVLAATDTD